MDEIEARYNATNDLVVKYDVAQVVNAPWFNAISAKRATSADAELEGIDYLRVDFSLSNQEQFDAFFAPLHGVIVSHLKITLEVSHSVQSAIIIHLKHMRFEHVSFTATNGIPEDDFLQLVSADARSISVHAQYVGAATRGPRTCKITAKWLKMSVPSNDSISGINVAWLLGPHLGKVRNLSLKGLRFSEVADNLWQFREHCKKLHRVVLETPESTITQNDMDAFVLFVRSLTRLGKLAVSVETIQDAHLYSMIAFAAESETMIDFSLKASTLVGQTSFEFVGSMAKTPKLERFCICLPAGWTDDMFSNWLS